MVLLYRNNALLTPPYQHTPLVKTFKGCFYATFGRLRFYCQSSSMKQAEKRCLPTETNNRTARQRQEARSTITVAFVSVMLDVLETNTWDRVANAWCRYGLCNSILRFFKIVWNENRSKERRSLCFKALSIRGKTFFFFCKKTVTNLFTVKTRPWIFFCGFECNFSIRTTDWVSRYSYYADKQLQVSHLTFSWR